MKQHYYVYMHREPISDEIVYIGHGCNERAWTTRPGKSKQGGGHRKPEHSAWCFELMDAGLTPNDWVQIVKQGMTKQQAQAYEQHLIIECRPRFNYKPGTDFKLSDQDAEQAFELREQGLFYHQIAERLGVSTMSVWRRLNG